MSEHGGDETKKDVPPPPDDKTAGDKEPPKQEPRKDAQPPPDKREPPSDEKSRKEIVDKLKRYELIVNEMNNPANIQRRGQSESYRSAKKDVSKAIIHAAQSPDDPNVAEKLNLVLNGLQEILTDYDLTDEMLFPLYPVINYLIDNPNAPLFSAEGQPDTKFEESLRRLFQQYDSSYNTFGIALTNAAKLGGGRRLLGSITPEFLEQKLHNIAVEEAKKRAEHGAGSGTREQELDSLLAYLKNDEEGQELAKAIYDPDYFLTYMGNLYKGENGLLHKALIELSNEIPEFSQQQLTLHPENRDKLLAEAKKLADIRLSFEVMDRTRRMAAQLFKRAYTTDIEMLYAESLTKGNPFRNPRTVAEDLKNMLNTLAGTSFKGHPDLEGINFFQISMKEVPMRVPRIQKDNTFDFEEKTLIIPVPNPRELTGFTQFMYTVTQAVATEDESGEVLHDIISISSRVPGSKYWETLLQYVEQKLGSVDIDAFNSLFDQDPIRFASVMGQKLQELEMAKFDWMLKPTLGQPDPDTKLTTVDKYVQDYTIRRYNDIFNKTQGRIYRALSLARGDQAAITMTRVTLPAQADPDLEAGMSATFSSPGQKMYPAYSIIGWGGMQGTRWMSPDSTQDLTIFNVVEGKGTHRVLTNWEHTKRFDEFEKVKNSFKHGKDAQDVKEGNVRFFELLNIGKVGSVYDRAGWRDYHMYEGWLVREDMEVNGNIQPYGRVNILESWKALENIGTEMLKDFINNIDKQGGDFFGAENNKGRRKELVEYIYKRYMVNPYEQKNNEQINQDIENLFAKLEEIVPDTDLAVNGYAPKKPRKAAYDTFFYQAITRALAQQIPTKFLRIESDRRRKVSERRDRTYREVQKIATEGVQIADLRPVEPAETTPEDSLLQPAPVLTAENESYKLSTKIKSDEDWAKQAGSSPMEETYYAALQDLCFVETLIMEEGNQILDKHLEKNPDVTLHQVDLSKVDNLTPQRMQEIFTRRKKNDKGEYVKNDKGEYVYEITLDDDPAKDLVRKRNALAVLEATRKYLFTTKLDEYGGKTTDGTGTLYLDEFARIYKMPAPYAPPLAVGVERLRRHLLAHKAAGSDMPRRAIADLVAIEKDVHGNIGPINEAVEHMAHDGKADELIKLMSKVDASLTGFHGKDTARPVNKWILFQALPKIMKDKSARHWYSFMQQTHASIISEKKSGYISKFKEYDETNMHHLLVELQEAEIFPAEPFSTGSAPTYLDVYKIGKDGKFVEDEDGNLIPGKEKIRKPDFKDVFHQIEHTLISENPTLHSLKKLMPAVSIFALLYLFGIINNAWDAENKTK